MPTAAQVGAPSTAVALAITGTPTTGQVLTATSGTAASWQTPSGGGAPMLARTWHHLSPAGGAAPALIGVVLNPVGTVLTDVPSDTSDVTRHSRLRHGSNATPGTMAEFKPNSATAGMFGLWTTGAVHFVACCGVALLGDTQRVFLGMDNNGTNSATNRALLSDSSLAEIGIALDRSVSPNWHFVCGQGGSAPTIVDLGASFEAANTDRIELAFSATSALVTWTVRNVTTGAVATGTQSTNLPTGVQLTEKQWQTNNTTPAGTQVCLYGLDVWST